MPFSKKKGLYSELNCDLSIFVANFRCLLKKGPHSESSSNLSIFVPILSDLPITCATTIIFSKSSAALLGFSKFCGTKHKMPICFATPKLFKATHSLRSPVVGYKTWYPVVYVGCPAGNHYDSPVGYQLGTNLFCSLGTNCFTCLSSSGGG